MSDLSRLPRARWMIPFALLAASFAHASVDSTGQLLDEIRVEAPAFHAITPEVALRYASDGSNGFVGVGWHLDLGPTITRVSAGRGIPRNDASDRFLLDGQALVACVDPSASPSCVTAKAAFGSVAGFFSTMIESYERLRRDGTGWTLWRRDGTQLTFASVDGGLTHRVSEVRDTHGNRVRHTWWCDEACYPDTIAYADRPGIPGATIRFVREDRPDKLSRGHGSGFTRTKYRLHAIEVRMDGQLLRAYQLGYTQSLANGASIVSSIQQFGRDAVVSNGTYAAGATPALPATTFTTPSQTETGTLVNTHLTSNNLTAMTETRVPYAPHFDGDQVSYSLAQVWDGDGDHVRPHGQLTGDFNGDGREDWLVWSVKSKDCTVLETNTILSTKTGHAAKVTSSLGNVGGYASPTSQPATPCPALALHVADITGDRREDLIAISDGKLTRILAGPAGTFTEQPPIAWSSEPSQRCAVGDLDGDRRADLACTTLVPGGASLTVARAQAAGTWAVTTSNLAGVGVTTSHQLGIGDVTGDGLADLVIVAMTGATVSIFTGASDGAGNLGWTSQATSWPSTGRLEVTDVDGDGRADVVLLGSTVVDTAFAAKGSSLRFRDLTSSAPPDGVGQPGDHDGDGRVDLLNTEHQRWSLGRGDGTFAPPNADLALPGCSPTDPYGDVVVRVRPIDLNGDGRSDILCTSDDWILTLRARMAGVLANAPAHAWIQADTSGDGVSELVYITPLAPRGYRITTVNTETQQRVVFDLNSLSNGQVGAATKALDEPDTQRFLAMDVGSPTGAPDGKTDLVLVDTYQGALRIYTLLSTGNGGFTGIVAFPAGGIEDLEAWQPAQLDGDGRGDLVHPRLLGGGIVVESLRARGDGQWDVIATTTSFAAGGLSTPGLIVVDLTGDGLSDIVHAQCCNPATGGSVVRSVLRNPDGSVSERTMPSPGYFRDLRRLKIADVNGDGLADLVHVSTTGSRLDLQVYASDGNGDFQYRTQTVSWTSTSPEDANLLEDSSLVRFMDINGDRRTDLVHLSTYVDTSGQLRSALLTAQAPITDAPTPAWPAQLTKGLVFQSYDHDPWRWQPWVEPTTGNLGLFYVHPVRTQSLLAHPARDRVTRIANGSGAVTTVTYAVLRGGRTYLPEHSLPLVVTELELRDEAYSPAVTETLTYAYGDARYSIALGQLGFGWMQTTDRDSRELVYSTLDDQCGARPSRVLRMNTANAVHSYSMFSYVATGAAPHTCDRQVTDDYECDVTSCRFARSEVLTLDTYGNAAVRTTSAAGALTTMVYAPPIANALPFITNLPAYELRYDATAAGLVLSSLTTFGYDGNVFSTGPGFVGELRTASRFEHSTQYRDTVYTYDATGQLLTVTDPRSQVDAYTYDTRYGLSPVRSCHGKICSDLDVDPVSRLVTQTTDANSAVTTFTYDGYGRPRRTTFPGGGHAETSYLAAGVITGPAAHRQRVRVEHSDDSPGDHVLWSEGFHDGLGRTYRVTREGGATVDTQFADASSRPAGISGTYAAGGLPDTWTMYAYDAAARLVSTTHADGSTRSNQYLVGKRVDRDELGHDKTTILDGHGRVSQVIEHVGATQQLTRYDRDGEGRLRRVIDHLGFTTSIDYDVLGRKSTTVDPDRGLTRFAYLANDLLASITDAAGQMIRYDYDGAGRQVLREDLDAAGTIVRTATWQWDTDAGGTPAGASAGRVVAMTDQQDGTLLHTTSRYDTDGRIVDTTRCIDGTCLSMGQSFDAAGRLATLTYPDVRGNPGEAVVHTYDASGRLASVGGYATQLGYDLDGRLASLAYGNGVTTTRAYDPNRRWIDSTVTTGPQGQIYAASYGHDVAGRIHNVSEHNPNQLELEFTYDPLGRLLQVGSSDPARSEGFSYDALGRMRWSTTTGDVHHEDPAHPHAPTSGDAGFRRSYDVLGNLTRLGDPDRRDLLLEWTPDGRLASTSAGQELTRYAYGPDGMRIKKAAPNQTSLYFGGLVELVDGRLVTYYMAGEQLLARRDGAGVSYYTTDLDRSTRVVTDARGRVTNRYDYAAFGRVHAATEGTPQDQEHGGGRRDDESALTYMNARYYDPALAHFVSADTLIPDVNDPQSFHRYAYAQQDPINFWDPSGHMKQSVEYKKELESRTSIDSMVRRAGFYCGTGICWSIPIEMLHEILENGRWARWSAANANRAARVQEQMRADEAAMAAGTTTESATVTTKALAEKVTAKPTATEHGEATTDPNWKGVPFKTPEQLKAEIAARLNDFHFRDDTALTIETAKAGDHGFIGPDPKFSSPLQVWTLFTDLGESIYVTPVETTTTTTPVRERRPAPGSVPPRPPGPRPVQVHRFTRGAK